MLYLKRYKLCFKIIKLYILLCAVTKAIAEAFSVSLIKSCMNDLSHSKENAR